MRQGADVLPLMPRTPQGQLMPRMRRTARQREPVFRVRASRRPESPRCSLGFTRPRSCRRAVTRTRSCGRLHHRYTRPHAFAHRHAGRTRSGGRSRTVPVRERHEARRKGRRLRTQGRRIPRTFILRELSSCGYISGTHGELKFFPNEDCWGIRDCGSTNGTFINGNRLEKNKWYTLKAGYRLRIATLDFNVEQA